MHIEYIKSKRNQKLSIRKELIYAKHCLKGLDTHVRCHLELVPVPYTYTTIMWKSKPSIIRADINKTRASRTLGVYSPM